MGYGYGGAVGRWCGVMNHHTDDWERNLQRCFEGACRVHLVVTRCGVIATLGSKWWRGCGIWVGDDHVIGYGSVRERKNDEKKDEWFVCMDEVLWMCARRDKGGRRGVRQKTAYNRSQRSSRGSSW